MAPSPGLKGVGVEGPILMTDHMRLRAGRKGPGSWLSWATACWAICARSTYGSGQQPHCALYPLLLAVTPRRLYPNTECHGAAWSGRTS